MSVRLSTLPNIYNNSHERRGSIENKPKRKHFKSITSNEGNSKMSFNNLKKFKLKIKYSSGTKDGLTNGTVKINQDTILLKTNLNNKELFNIYAVLDGHGSEGHLISSLVKNCFSDYISNETNVETTMTNTDIISFIKDNDYSVLKKCFQNAEEKIAQSNIDANFSGSTAVLVVQVENSLFCANAGDSRAILYCKNGDIINLSHDHKPENPGEKERIIANGGRVEKFYEDGEYVGPYRVWYRTEGYPGLAMSRSLGDFVSKKVGCIYTPDIIEHTIDKNSLFLIIASDGIWEFLSNQDVCKMIKPYYMLKDTESASRVIIQEAAKQWKKECSSQDDISCIVVFFYQSY